MSSPTPNQQQCISETFGLSSAVVAGAGSGKTDTLTRRIVFALEHPELSGVSDIDNILAITYTKKAANELKSRIKAAIDEAATPENGLGLQALKVDGAWISTIHGMCSRILKENALTLGIDPAFSVIENEACNQLLGEAIETTLVRAMSAPDSSEESQLLSEYSRDDVRGMIAQLIESVPESLEDDSLAFFITPPESDIFSCFQSIVRFTKDLMREIEDKYDQKKKVGETEADFYEFACRALSDIYDIPATSHMSEAFPSPERFAELEAMSVEQLLALTARIPALSGKTAIAKTMVKELGITTKQAFESLFTEMRLCAGSRYIPALLGLTIEAAGNYDELKRTQGVLDNNDLMKQIARAFSDEANSALVRHYADQFKLVMVDEFQDTNQMQIDMINLVAGGGSPSEKLCVVGDAQQSIYRFRNADLSVFQEHVRRVRESENGRVIELGDNFRSHDDILEFTRGVFSRVFQDDFLDLRHGRNEELANKNAPFCGGEQGDDVQVVRRVNMKVFEGSGVSARAAQEIAADFKQLCDRGNRPGEMAVLLGKMTNAGVYAKALQAVGLKCAITGGTVFKDDLDVAIVADLCEALANPLDSHALADVLTSDIFCLEAADLLQLTSRVAQGKTKRCALGQTFVDWAREDSREQIFEQQRGMSLQLRCAVEVFGSAAARVGQTRFSSLVEEVIVNSGWLDRLGEDGISRAGNVFKAIRVLRSLEDDLPVGPRQLAEQFRAHVRVAKEAPGVLSAKGDDFVRIMTIHASKGLSIPIVAVAEADYSAPKGTMLTSLHRGNCMYISLDAGASVRNLPSKLLSRSPSSLVENSPSFFASSDQALQVLFAAEREQTGKRTAQATGALDFFAALHVLNAAAELEEHQRKLYVAYTRAKESLIATQKRFKSPQKHQLSSGALQVNEAIAEMLTGDRANENFTKATTLVSTVAQLPRTEMGSENASATWEVRLQVFPGEKKKSSSRENDASEETNTLEETSTTEVAVEASGENEEENVVCGGYPQGELILYDEVRPVMKVQGECAYRSQWSSGIVSASSLKASDCEHESAPDAPDAPDAPGAPGAPGAPYAPALLTFSIESDSSDDTFAITASENQVDAESPAPREGADATERGTAFHALGEWAATHRDSSGAFVCPPPERLSAIARFYGLSAAQKEELSATLERWLASPQAAHAASYRHVRPEFPFWVSLEPSTNFQAPLVLEGFIDLLAYEQPNKGSAYVIDYKTGTSLDTDEKRRKAYGLQAACYAYALMMQGFEDVQLDFVFVDQPDPTNPALPVVTRFSSAAEAPYNLEELRALIASKTQ